MIGAIGTVSLSDSRLDSQDINGIFGDDEISGAANVFDNDFVDNQMEV